MTNDDIQRFWSKVEKAGGCWLWLDAAGEGYGQFSLGRGKSAKAHRIAWELVRGEVPFPIVNQCGNTMCVNPDHWKERGKMQYAANGKRIRYTKKDISDEQIAANIERIGKREDARVRSCQNLNQQSGDPIRDIMHHGRLHATVVS